MPMFKRDRDPFHTSEAPVASPPPPMATSTRPAAAAAPEPIAKDPPVAAATHPAEQRELAPQPTFKRETAAVIDKNSEITGTLHSQGNVLVEGCFQGEIEAKETVWVERGAQTQGQLRANDGIVAGSFSGEIACQHRLHITATASISGEIKTPVLVIEGGATVNCRFSMTRAGR